MSSFTYCENLRTVNLTVTGDITAPGIGEGIGKSYLIDLIYPVGSVYMSFNSTSPTTLFGGEWEQIVDKFLWCTNSSGETGGEATHTLTVDEMPSHRHTVEGDTGNMSANSSGSVSMCARGSWLASARVVLAAQLGMLQLPRVATQPMG